MKGFITKIISILVIAMMIINSSLLTIISVAIDEVEKIIDESKIDANYELNIRKYVNYEVGEERGLMVQTYLKDGIEYKEGQEQVPIKATNVVINAPKVNGEYPQKVEVIVDSTKLTNGDDNGKDVNYSYNNENGELTIITENKADEKGNVYSEYSTEDKNEYKLNFYYSSNCYDAESVKRTLEFTGKVQFELSKDEGIVVNKDISQSFEVSENISGLISTEVTTSDIYNGYIESNKDNDTKYRTEYTEKVGIDIDYKDIFDEISISENDKFVKNDKEIETEDIVYKGIKINKNDVLSKLGEDGTLKITNENGEILAEINKDTEAKEDGTVEVTYQNEAKNIKVDISKPVSLGRIEIENTKEIKETMKDIDVTNIKTESNISCINNVTETTKAVDEETKEEKDVETVKTKEIYNYVSTNLVEIKASKTEVKVSANNVNWTNNVQNDVTFTTTLVTNGAEYSLFKNPVINIKLPQEVEKVILGNVSLLYDDNLKIKSANIEEIDGCKVIKIEIDGIQKSYTLNSMTDGVNVIIPTIVIAKKDINTVNTSVEFNCYNSNNTNINGKIDVKINSITENISNETVKTQISTNEQATINKETVKESDISVVSSAQVGNQTLKSGDTVYEEQVIKYSVKITNNTTTSIKNLNVVGQIPEGMSYANISKGNGDDFDSLYEYVTDDNVKEYTKTIEELKANDSIEVTYNVVVNKLLNNEYEKETSSIIKVKSESDNELYNWICNYKIKKSELKVRLKSGNSGSGSEANEWQYYLEIDNVTDKEFDNLNITFYVPEKLKLKRAFLQFGDHDLDVGELGSNRELNMKLEKLEPNEKVIVAVYTLGCDFDDNIYQYDINMTAKVSGDDINTYWSNENIQTMYIEGLEIIQTSDKEGQEIKYKEQIEYNAVIKNVGKDTNAKYTYVDLIDKLPENVIPISMEYDKYVYDEQQDNFIKYKETVDVSKMKESGIGVDILIPKGEQANVNIIVEANLVYVRTEINNTIILKGNNINTKISNTIKNVILPYNYIEPDPSPDPTPDPTPDPNPDSNPDSNPENKKYNISGVVWNDENKNGARENTEKLLSDITVKLFDVDTNQIVTSNNKKQITKTDENGAYKFSEVKKGNYIVLFEYDTESYELAYYKMQGVSEENNSDVIIKDVSIDEVEKKVGITNTIKVTDSDIKNIDMGLIRKLNFDLSLKKYITSVKVINNAKNKTEEHKYNESQFVKVEIPSKEIANTTLEIEYKIKVTNEGELSGYVNEIFDYVPSGISFSEITNPKWTKNANGDLTTTELAGIEIKPGESKEVTLILTKQLTEDSLGTIVNAAEIAKVVNSDNIPDIDSTAANKNVDEDDYAEAQIIVSVKTGAVLHTTLAFVILAVLILMIVLIKKHKIKLDKIIAIFVVALFAGIAVNQNISTAYTLEGLANWAASIQGNPGARTVNTNSTGFATHGSTEDKYVDKDVLHCTDNSGTYSMCGGGSHTYTRKSVSASISSVTWVASSTNTYTDASTNVEMDRLGTDYNIAGPYVINKSGDRDQTITSIIVYGTSGQIVNSAITNEKGEGKSISFGESFYIIVPRDEKEIIKVDINFSYTAVYTYSVSYAISEAWTCDKVSGSHGRHGCSSTAKAQPLERRYHGNANYDDTEDTSTSVSLPGAKLKRGNLEIVKRDADSNAEISGAVFNVKGTGEVDYYDEDVVMTEGRITITDLEIGNYIVKEKDAPYGYTMSLQGDQTQTVEIEVGATSEITFYNKKYGNLNIKKVDQNTQNSYLEDLKFNDIGFKVYINEDGMNKYIKTYIEGSPTYLEFSTNKNEAYEFKTNSNGEIALRNIPQVYQYYIEETSLPNHLNQYYDMTSTIYSAKINNDGETVQPNVNNQQVYMDLAGYVWEDRVNSSKVNTRDNLYVQPEPLISEITVRLKNKNNGSVIATQTTNSKGAYKFSKVKISELKNYTIEFEYNGLKYESVTANLNQANGSKAVEKTTDRTNFNNSFASITGGNAKGNSTTGYSRNQKGTVTNNLTYKNGTYSSTLVQNTKYITGSANGIVTAQNGSTGVRIYADTNTAGTQFTWKAGVKQITNINLGIAVRNQADFAIATDLDAIDMTFNGYSHTYKYDRRIRASGIDIFSELQKWNKTDAQKKQENSNYPRSYTRSIYKNYVYASGVDGEGKLSEQNKLQIYLTYKIQVKNESSLYMTANEIANYFDSTLDYVSSYYIDGNGNKVNVAWTAKGDKNGYKQIRTSGIKDLKIQPGSSKTIYLTMKKNSILQWKNKNSLKESTYNITEITSYSCYTNNGKYYAAIDKDSAPDNIKVGTLSTYEDDTDMAPVVEFTFDEPRTISGYVFEDSTSNNLNTNAERKGDGKYNASNDGFVENVKVELITKSNNQTAYIYPKAVTSANFNADKAVYVTTKNGKGYYEFVGIIPNEYYIKFTYGDGTVVYKKSGESVNGTTQDYKSTIITSEQMKNAYGGNEFNVNKNPRWYQDNSVKGYSTAVDDYATRKNINKALSTITYGVSAGYDKKNSGTANLQTISARTPNMNIAIENVNKETTNLDENRTRLYDNIDFGIVERPRQNLNVTKEINYIKLTLAAGSVLIEGNPQTDTLPYVTYPQRGILKIEADSEITQGATLEVGYIINVKNNSELDYDSEVYYKYGTKSSNDKAVNLTINSLVDYMDDELKTTYVADGNEPGVWKLRTSTNIKDLIGDNVYSAVKNKRNILVNNWAVTLKPTESKNITVAASKILSAQDEMAFANYVEILSYSNSVGRFYGEQKNGKWVHMTPGNYVYGVSSTHEGDDNAYDNANRAKISIVPSTGDNNIIYLVIGISSLVVIAGGVVLIKKFVL